MTSPLKTFKKIPQHVAIIMDGNGRWAEQRGLPRLAGHARGTEVSEDIITYARDLQIKYLTLYAFSSENWDRPAEEVAGLMELLKDFLHTKLEKMLKNDIRLNAIGRIDLLPSAVYQALQQTMQKTAHCRSMTLTLALSYGARDEILRACQSLIASGVTEVSEENFTSHLFTKNIPDPDLMIRTSGEVRISNFLLWQAAYAELYFEPVLWPDYTPAHLLKALEEYEKRERRFGKTGAQVQES